LRGDVHGERFEEGVAISSGESRYRLRPFSSPHKSGVTRRETGYGGVSTYRLVSSIHTTMTNQTTNPTQTRTCSQSYHRTSSLPPLSVSVPPQKTPPISQNSDSDAPKLHGEISHSPFGIQLSTFHSQILLYPIQTICKKPPSKPSKPPPTPP